jgi:hypothetical protein
MDGSRPSTRQRDGRSDDCAHAGNGNKGQQAPTPHGQHGPGRNASSGAQGRSSPSSHVGLGVAVCRARVRGGREGGLKSRQADPQIVTAAASQVMITLFARIADNCPGIPPDSRADLRGFASREETGANTAWNRRFRAAKWTGGIRRASSLARARVSRRLLDSESPPEETHSALVRPLAVSAHYCSTRIMRIMCS